MSNENDERNNAQNAMLGWLIAPLAILLALLADYGLDFGLVLEMKEMEPYAVIAIAAILGMAPRVMKEMEIIRQGANLSLLTLVASLLLAEGTAIYMDSNFIGLIFFIVMFGGYLLDSSGRHEWNTVLIFGFIGLWTAINAAANFADTQTKLFTLGGQEYIRTAAWQEAIGFVFFNTIAIFVILGLLAAVLLRGIVTPATDKGWFGYIKPHDGGWNRATMPLQIALGVWAATHIAIMYYFNTLGDLDILQIWSEDDYHGYIGFWPAALTGVVALTCAWMAAERWYTRALMIGSMWALYIVSSLYESGHWSNDNFEGSWAVWIWFGITFFIGVLIYWFATHEDYGGWMNRELHEPSQARVFWSNHWAGIMTFMAFLVALAIRVQWYFVPSMNSAGLESWDLTGGSDPWYMKRVVEYVVAENAHLIWDADRNYPVGGINPRPPLFSWSMALGAMFLTNLGLSSDSAVWYSMLALPAIFGALIVFPMAGIAKDNFGKGAGVIAAWLIAFMPTHVQKSTWAMADHDSYALLFLTAAFMFYLRAVKAGGDERLSRHTNAYPSGIIKAMADVLKYRRKAAANAIAAGVCFSIVGLGWKGFVYGPAIIFLAYFVQVAMNMFRRKDSTILSAINILMLGTIYIMVLPFYAHPQLNLVLNSTGLTPLLFITLFTVAIAWITTGFRDKPWLLVLGSLFTGGIVFGVILYLLQITDQSNAWEILTTGSGYFTKNKIFGTIAEASAPSRGQLFASFGPIVFVLAIVMGIIALWDGIVKKSQTKLVLGMWVIVASYMAWSAGRFLFNAAPAMAVMGAWGIVTLWSASGASNMARSWRRMGIRTPGERISNARKAVWRTPQFSAIGLVLIMLIGQHAAYGIDAAMPRSQHEAEMDETIYNIAPDILRWNDFGFSFLDDSDYDPYDPNNPDRFYLGSFGSGYNDRGWNLAYDWLANQDTDVSYSHRPAFVSWWDYGFQALETGEHPSVSDNFQSGIPVTGNMLLARNQDDLAAMFIARLSEADLAYTNARTGERMHTSSFLNTLGNHLTDEQKSEFVTIATDLDSDGVIERSFKVVQVNGDVVMAEGRLIEDGLFGKDLNIYHKVYENGEPVPCPSDYECVDDYAFANEFEAQSVFNSNTRTTADTEENTTHYIFGDYWYTSDLVEEFDSVSTKIHRQNAVIALLTQMLSSSLDSEELHNLYVDLSNNEIYTVQDYNGAPGETITRDHEIRYFAIDQRLYPRAGLYSSEYSGGSPTGIFGAPTILSGQDFDTFMNEVYMTKRGQFNDEMTREEFDEEMRKDVLNQQSGATFDPLSLVDIRIDHTPAFFETMLARAYVGYGASSLGFATTEQPGQHFGQSGTPNSIMTNAVPLPGAMMNHFVIANWYNADDPNDPLGAANTLVKILKYYPGVEVSGKVAMSDDGQPLPNVRILIERDAFSGEDEVDHDEDTYWIPIGYTDADENGEWSYTVPAGKIRVSAYAGEFDGVEARDTIQTGEYAAGLGDLTTNTNDNRETNLITALLGQVANMSWMGEVTHNITGDQADRKADFDGNFDISVDSSGVSGTVTWTGHESFEGEALNGMDFVLQNIWGMTTNYTVSTTSGSFTTDAGDTRIIQGTGEVNFDVTNGTFDTQGNSGTVYGFTGNYTRTVLDGRSYTSNATFNGAGTILAEWIGYDAPACTSEEVGNETVVSLPTYNETVDGEEVTKTHIACLTEEADTYLFEGIVDANGRMTADGEVTVVKVLDGENFEGAGIFEGMGIANGTGLFVGEGTFSGPMVAPGSFYKTGLMPGTYRMIAMMENGREVQLPDPVEVTIDPTTDLEMKMPGSILQDTLYADYFTDGLPTPLANTTVELLDFGLGEDGAPVYIETDEEGNLSYGPIAIGDYQWRVDIDEDGWYEVEYNFTVGYDTSNISLDVSVPTKRDLVINLDAGDSGLDLSNRTLTFTNTESTDLNQFVVTGVSDENGIVHVEIDMGEWIISDETDSDYVLWHEVEVTEEDIELSLTYAVSVWVNGTIWIQTGLNEQDREPATNIVTVEARSGNILMESRTDGNGSYSFRMPAGVEFHVTADSFATTGTAVKVTGGMLITDAAQVTETDITLQYANMLEGSVWLRESPLNGSGIAWSNVIEGAAGAEVIATDDNGLEFRDEIDNAGNFLMYLYPGEWTLTVSNSDMNVDSVAITSDNESERVDLVAKPSNISVTMRLFLDTNDDGVWENGTAISPSFIISSVDEFGIDVNVTEDMYDVVTGELNLDLSVGTYIIDIGEDDPRDENASDYRKYATGLPTIYVGLSPIEDPFEILITPEYLVTGTVVMEDQVTPVDNSTVWLRNEAGDDFYPLITDENGTFAEYIPAGEWFVEVAPFTADDSNVTEILRAVLVVDGPKTDLVWETKTAMNVTMQLQEGLTESNITATRITAVSLDGLGNVSLGPSDNSGNISEVLMPGKWTLVLNRTETLEMWKLDEGVYNSDGNITANEWNVGIVTIDKSVLIGGKIFWDLDDDDTPSTGEGIENVSVSVTSDAFDETVETDSEGTWKLFVPIRDNYTVIADKAGFASVIYLDSVSSYVVNDTHESRDFEMSAGLVAVSGNVTDNFDAARLESATVTLYPASGIVRDPVAVTSLTYENGVLSWDAQIEPGNWIVVVDELGDQPNGGGIAIGLLEASVQDGATLDLEMKTGGKVKVTTSWLSIDSKPFHAGDVPEGVELEIDIGDGIEWEMSFDENGELVIVLPADVTANFASEFETTQHDMNLEMEYTAGLSLNVQADTEEERNLEFTRRVNSDLVIEIISVTSGTADFDESDLTELTAIEDGDGYKVITMKLGLTYDGTEISDEFTASSSFSVTPDAEYWSVEYLNGTGDDDWVDVMDLSMGIGENNSDPLQLLYTEIDVRITLPLQNQSLTFSEGHAVNMRFAADGGINEKSVRVYVPQQYNISLEDAPESIGVGVGQETLVTLRVVNDGNGDDSIAVQASLDCEGWSVTPAISNLTIAASSERSQSFTIRAPADAESDESCDVSFTADSEGDFDTQTASTEAKISVAKLVIDEGGVEPRNADAKANADGQFRIPISNEGFLTAPEVKVTLAADELGNTVYPEQVVTISVPANGVAYAVFDYSGLPPGDARLKVTVEVIGTPTHEESQESEIITIQFSNIADEDGESDWLVIVIVVLTGLVLFGGYKTAKKGSSGRF